MRVRRPARVVAAAALLLVLATITQAARYEERDGFFIKRESPAAAPPAATDGAQAGIQSGGSDASGGTTTTTPTTNGDEERLLMGKNFIMKFKRDDCARTSACYAAVQKDLSSIGCEDYVLFEHINMMAGKCFAPAANTFEARLNAVSFRATLFSRGFFGSVGVDATVKLSPAVNGSSEPLSFLAFTTGGGVWVPARDANAIRAQNWAARRRSWRPAPAPPPPPPPPPPPAPVPAPAPLAPAPVPGTTGSGSAYTPAAVYNWGLDRTNQLAAAPLDRDTTQCASRGTGVYIYVLDTGCRPTHDELRGRATTLALKAEYGQGLDGHGHGTHCAATAAGRNVGIAPDATVVCVKVLSDQGGGPFSDVIAGLNFVAGIKAANPTRRMIASMSVGGAKDTAVNAAVESVAAQGIVVVIAAGNANINVATTSPASAADSRVIVVGATDQNDLRASFSNSGDLVDIYAPGTNIYSAYHTGDSAYKSMNGTSMATPVAAGGVACIMAADLSKTCASADGASPDTDYLVRQLSHPYLTVVQRFGADKPLFYLPSGRPVGCAK